jgi:hypothetical protein
MHLILHNFDLQKKKPGLEIQKILSNLNLSYLLFWASYWYNCNFIHSASSLDYARWHNLTTQKQYHHYFMRIRTASQVS